MKARLASMLCALAAFVAGLAVSDSAMANMKVSKRERAKIERLLTKQDLTVRQVYRCRVKSKTAKEKRGRGRGKSQAVKRCRFGVSGVYPNGKRYRCSGEATKKGRAPWKLSPCYERMLWDELMARNLVPRNIWKCKRKGGMAKCNWAAEGAWPGEVPYRCGGKARYRVKKRTWDVDRCDNFYGVLEPLQPQPNPHPVFGFNDDWLDESRWDYFGSAAAVGAKTVRVVLAWGGVEPRRGKYQWDFYDKLYLRLQLAGLKPLWVLWSPPCWAQDNPSQCLRLSAASQGSYLPAESHYGELAQFAITAAGRYPNSQGIEIWNEPNHALFSFPRIDAARYGRMLRAVAGALAPRTDIPVVAGGLAPVENDNYGGMEDSKFMRQVYESGGWGPVDALAYHVYWHEAKNHDIKIRRDLAEVYSVMDAYGDRRPLWITEVGAESTSFYDEAGQAEVLADVYQLLRRIRNIPVVIVHRFFDGIPKVSGNGIDHYGVIATNGQPKPAYCALAHATGTVPPICLR